MWYHARDQSLNSPDNSLPLLSTGRIGRATSRNGLIWERDEVGSIDADKRGVSLGLNTDSWWGFDTAHIGLGQVLMPMESPSIRSQGGVYVMYYMGGSYEETKIVAYLDDDKKDRVSGDATIKGMKMKIGAAISQDGTTWGRVEGSDPSGACMVPYDTSVGNMQDISISTDEKGRLLEIPEELYCVSSTFYLDHINLLHFHFHSWLNLAIFSLSCRDGQRSLSIQSVTRRAQKGRQMTLGIISSCITAPC